MIDYLDTAEDIVVDDRAEEIVDAMDDIVEDNYSDIDNIADIDEENEDSFEDDDEEDDDDLYEEDDLGYVDYEVPEEY